MVSRRGSPVASAEQRLAELAIRSRASRSKGETNMTMTSERIREIFREGTFVKLGKVLPQGAQLNVEYLFVQGDEAVVELRSLATAGNGMRFDNRYCWVVYFDRDLIVRVRAYLDSAMVVRLFEENPT
jgi:ketosteroid isomerase-like protein